MLVNYITKDEFCDRVKAVALLDQQRKHFKSKSVEYIYDYLDKSSKPMQFYPMDIYICWMEFTLKSLSQATDISFDPAETDFDKFLRDASDALNRDIHQVDSDTFLTFG